MDKRIVVIGGGTGLSVILRGLKRVTKDLHAIVNVVDDGGSSGLLRKDFDMLPPGDMRNCILAMANSTPLMEQLFNYRFSKGLFDGQSFGNLMIAALEDITGSIEKAVLSTSSIFNITGRVYPVTTASIQLKGELENGRVVLGESALPLESLRQRSPIKRVDLYPSRPRTSREVTKVLETADLILVGPGSFYTSIMPALLVSGVKEGILRSQAPCIYIANLMSQPGETDGLKLRDYLRIFDDHLEDPIFHGVVVNRHDLSDLELEEYLRQQALPLEVDEEDREDLKRRGMLLREGNYAAHVDGYIRHDHLKLSRDILKFKEELDAKNA